EQASQRTIDFLSHVFMPSLFAGLMEASPCRTLKSTLHDNCSIVERLAARARRFRSKIQAKRMSWGGRFPAASNNDCILVGQLLDSAPQGPQPPRSRGRPDMPDISRRTFAAAGALLAATNGACANLANSSGATPASDAAVEADLLRYVAFGNKRAGGAGDT